MMIEYGMNYVDGISRRRTRWFDSENERSTWIAKHPEITEVALVELLSDEDAQWDKTNEELEAEAADAETRGPTLTWDELAVTMNLGTLIRPDGSTENLDTGEKKGPLR